METGGLGGGKVAGHGSDPVRSSVTQESKDTLVMRILSFYKNFLPYRKFL